MLLASPCVCEELRISRSARAPNSPWPAPSGTPPPVSNGNYNFYVPSKHLVGNGTHAEAVQSGAGPRATPEYNDTSAYDPERPTWEQGGPTPLPDEVRDGVKPDPMEVEDGEVVNDSQERLFAQQLYRPTLLADTQRSPRSEHEVVKVETNENTVKLDESVESPLPPKEEILAEIMEKDDLIAQFENELEQAQKHRAKLLSSATSISQSASTSPFSAESGAVKLKTPAPPRLPRPPVQLSFDASAMPSFVSEILTSNNELARSTCEKIERRLDPPEIKPENGASLVHRLSALPPQLLMKIKSYLREERAEMQALSRSLSHEYTVRWGAWRKRLHALNVIEDDGDDELVRIYRQQGGRIRIPTPHTRTVSYAPVNRERFLKTLAQIPALQLNPPARCVDRNRIVEKPKQEEAQQRVENAWLPNEEETFVQMYKKVNKDFVKIAAHLPGRTVKDVIKFYYVNKKRLGLKKFSIALRSYQSMAMEDSSLALSNPLAIDDPDNYGSTLQWSGRNTQRSSMRLTGKKTVNYSERALEQAAMGVAAAEAWDAAHPPSDEDEDEPAVWSELEKERFLDAHARWGPDFRNIALFLKTKTIGQCKSFYTKYGKSLGLSSELPNTSRGRLKGRAATPTLQPPLASSGAQPIPLSAKKKANPNGSTSSKKKGSSSVNTSLNGSKKIKSDAEKDKKSEKRDGSKMPGKKRGRKEKSELMRIEVEKNMNSSISEAPPPPPRFTWSDDQKSTIVALLSVHGRNFAAIASSLDPPIPPESVAEFYATFRVVDSLDDLLPETVRRTRRGGTGPSSALGSPFGSPGPVRKKKKVAVSTPEDSRKRKREDGEEENSDEAGSGGEQRSNKRTKGDPVPSPGAPLPPPPVATLLPKLPPPPSLKAPVLPPPPSTLATTTVTSTSMSTTTTGEPSAAVSVVVAETITTTSVAVVAPAPPDEPPASSTACEGES